MPVTTWRYRDEADRSTLHMGPMAQDWHRAFGFTRDDRTINMSDLDGVNLAGVQALERRTAAQAGQVKALQDENASLRADVAALREQNARFEERLRQLEQAARAPR